MVLELGPREDRDEPEVTQRGRDIAGLKPQPSASLTKTSSAPPHTLTHHGTALGSDSPPAGSLTTYCCHVVSPDIELPRCDLQRPRIAVLGGGRGDTSPAVVSGLTKPRSQLLPQDKAESWILGLSVIAEELACPSVRLQRQRGYARPRSLGCTWSPNFDHRLNLDPGLRLGPDLDP